MLRMLKKFVWRLFGIDIIQGMQVTGKEFYASKITVQYPDEYTPKSSRHRGLHALKRYNNGEEKCIACKLCEAICPAMAITIVPEERPDDLARRAKTFDLDLSKCMFCGLCEEACPVDAIVETKIANYHFTDVNSHVLTKSLMLAIGDEYEKQTPTKK